MDSLAPTTPPDPSPSRRHIFVTRLFSTVVLWTVIGLAILWQNQAIMVGIACFFGIAGAVEYFRLLSRQGLQRGFAVLGLGICLCYWTAVLVHVLTAHTEPPLWYDLAALTAVVQGSFVLCYQHQLEGTITLQRIFSTVFGVVYTVIFYGFLVRLMYFPGTAANFNGVFLMLYLIMVTKFSDMGAYAIGSLIGRHKMIEHISPKKTWEGFGGAMLGSLVAAVLLLWFFATHLTPLDWLHGLILVPILVCVGVSGDLAESVIKRCLAIKDSGHKLPGIGGILDLTDSLLFTAPVFYFYLVAFTK